MNSSDRSLNSQGYFTNVCTVKLQITQVVIYSFFLRFSEDQSELFSSTQNTIQKLNLDGTDLRQKYEENIKELARLQKEKAEISENFELTQDRLQDVQREMREMRSEYDNKLLISQQTTQDTVIDCTII